MSPVIAVVAQARDFIDWATLVLGLFTALGTVGAVLLALFLPRVEERRTRPRLQLSAAPEGGVGIVLQEGGAEQISVRLHNARGKQMARDVEVRVVSWTVKPDLTHIVAEDAVLVVDKASNGTDVTVTTVPPGHARSVPLAVITEAPTAQGTLEFYAYFCTSPSDMAERSRMEPLFSYTTYVTVTGSNFDAIVFKGTLGLVTSEEPDEDGGVDDVLSITWTEPLKRVPEIPASAIGAAWISGKRV